jgi:guanyl-specific ribonuclease Sa
MVAMRDSSGTALAVGRLTGCEPLGFEAGDNNWYRFVANGPTGKIDPAGLYEDLAIEVVSIGTGAWSFCTNVGAGNVGAAALDACGIVLDVGLAVIPGAPGGTGLVVKAGREAAERASREAAEQAVHAVREAAEKAAKGAGKCAGRAALNLSDDIAVQVDDAILRASQGKIRFPGHDGKPYLNRDGKLPPRSDYTEWTAAASGAKRRNDRVIIAGNPAHPDAIYYWDHVSPPVRIWP